MTGKHDCQHSEPYRTSQRALAHSKVGPVYLLLQSARESTFWGVHNCDICVQNFSPLRLKYILEEGHVRKTYARMGDQFKGRMVFTDERELMCDRMDGLRCNRHGSWNEELNISKRQYEKHRVPIWEAIVLTENNIYFKLIDV